MQRTNPPEQDEAFLRETPSMWFDFLVNILPDSLYASRGISLSRPGLLVSLPIVCVGSLLAQKKIFFLVTIPGKDFWGSSIYRHWVYGVFKKGLRGLARLFWGVFCLSFLRSISLTSTKPLAHRLAGFFTFTLSTAQNSPRRHCSNATAAMRAFSSARVTISRRCRECNTHTTS